MQLFYVNITMLFAGAEDRLSRFIACRSLVNSAGALQLHASSPLR